MKLKFIKKMIAVLCAGVMTTSCAFGSVGAVRTGFAFVGDEKYDVEEIDYLISDCIDELNSIIGKVKRLKGSDEDIKDLLAKLANVKSSLENTHYLKLGGEAMVKRVDDYLKSYIFSDLKDMSKAFSENRTDSNLLICLDSYFDGMDGLQHKTSQIQEILEFSTALSDKHRELRRAKCSIKNIGNVQEQTRLQNLCDKAENFYKPIRSKIMPNNKWKKQKDEFFNLANQAINEINKARDAQNNIHLPVPPEPDNMNEVPAPMAGEKANLNRIKEEKKEREREAAKKQAEELAKKKEELKQVENEEKALVRKKLEINRKYVNLRNELSNIAFLRGEGIYIDSTQIERDIKAAEKAMNEINEKIKKEIERKNKLYSELGAINFNLGK